MEYHRDLDEIDRTISRMLSLVEETISAASAAFLGAEDEAERAVAAGARETEALHRSVETLVPTLLIRLAPEAGELRFLLAALRIAPEAEMTAALAANLARRGAMHIGDELPARVRGLVAKLFAQSSTMWRRAGDAFLDRDPTMYAALEREDEDIDELHASLMAELVSCDLRPPILMEMALVARFLERLGDHAVEVGRWIETFASAVERVPSPWRARADDAL